jgi:hypothetical protein
MRSWKKLVMMAVALVGAAGCNCDDTVQQTFARFASNTDALDFGPVAVRTEATQTLTLRSEGTGELRFDAVTIEGSDADAFYFIDPLPEGFRLGQGATHPLEVAFNPGREGAFDAEIVFETNDDESPHRVSLGGEGIVPTIQICHDPGGEVDEADLDCAEPGEPLVLDFDRAPAGERIVRVALVRNVGEARLVIEGVTFDDGTLDAGFSPEASTQGTEIPRGGGVLLPIGFLGAAQGHVTGRVVIHSNDLDQPEAAIDLVAEGMANTPPVACAAAVRTVGIDGSVHELAEPAASVRVQPRDRVELTAHPFEDCSWDAEDEEVLRYEWTLVAQPDGENAQLNNASSGPAPGTAQHPPSLDVAGVGVYRVALVVYDSLDAASSPAEVVIDATPDDDLIVELAWHVGVDLDLHLIAPGAGTAEERIFCDPLDCFWDTCRPTSEGIPSLHWGNVGGAIGDDGDSETDPILRFDNLGDTVQRGSETLRLETLSLFRAAAVDPGLGPYLIGVHYFESKGITEPETFDAEVTVIHRGEVLYQSTHTFDVADEGTFWVAGTFDANALEAGEDFEDLGQALAGPIFIQAYTPPPTLCED